MAESSSDRKMFPPVAMTQALLPTALASLVKPKPGDDDERQISKVLSYYTLCIDGKQWDLLTEVFHDDARTNYSALIGEVQGLEALKQSLINAVGVSTHLHILGSPAIDVAADRKSAKSATYFYANHFGVKDLWGQGLWAWAVYYDEWLPDAAGRWKIIRRDLVYPGEDGKPAMSGSVKVLQG